MWSVAEKCNNGCNEQTGKCKTDSDAGNNGGSGNNSNDNNGNSSGNNDDQAIPCTRDENYYETKKCIDGHSYSCECVSHDENDNGDEICNKYLWIENDICKGGCDESTGQCKKAECSIEQAEVEVHECFEDYSFKCEKDDSSNASWKQEELCYFTGCNTSTGRCNLCEEKSYICEEISWENNNYSYSYKCEDGHFNSYYDCDKSGCDSSSGKCRCTDFVEGYKTCDDYGDNLLTCINGLWEIEECKIRCDSNTSSCVHPECSVQGAFRCDGDMSQKCDQEVWKNYENCSGKTCNEETGRCE
jgi:hypothetical protein